MLIPGTVPRDTLYPQWGQYALFHRLPPRLVGAILPDGPAKSVRRADRGGRISPAGRSRAEADAAPRPGGARPSRTRREPGRRAQDRRGEAAAVIPQHGSRRRTVRPPPRDLPRAGAVLPIAVHS